METDLIGFIDESKKPMRDPSTGKVSGSGEHYVVAAAVVLRGDLSEIREALVAQAGRLGYPLHYVDLRRRQRRLDALDAISSIDGWEAHLFETAQPLSLRHNSEHHLRAKTLEAAITTLGSSEGVSELVLESRADGARGFHQLDQKDNQLLQTLMTRDQAPHGLHLRHADKSEPLLQLPDLVSGARTDHLCGVDREFYARIAHRVRTVTVVLGKPG